jgi:hypothetical protein
MKGSLQTVWRWVKWPLVVLIVAYLALVVWRAFDLYDQDKTAAAVAAIHAARITLADVGGVNLPPQPNQEENDATVEGIDKNNNGIRDDVELAIFAKYPSDKKARAAALQYAMAEQMYLNKVTNTPTWKAVAEETTRAQLCVLKTSVDRKEIESVVFNTLLRKEAEEEAYEFITSHGEAPGDVCDVSLQ